MVGGGLHQRVSVGIILIDNILTKVHVLCMDFSSLLHIQTPTPEKKNSQTPTRYL